MNRPAVTTAVEAVAADLERRILAGDLPPGTRLPEAALSAHYDVARHTLRAALRAVAAAGLAVVEPHRGARVAALDEAALRDLFELRAALEVESVRLLAARGGLTPLPGSVRAAADRLDVACTSRPVDRAVVDAAHADLHHAIVAAAGSARITRVHAGLAAQSRLALVQSRAAMPVTELARAHHELLAELPRRGEQAMREHLRAGALAASPRPSRYGRA